MSSSRLVPQVPYPATVPAGRVRDVVRRHGVVRLARESLLRFRYGDGFSHARALALLLCLALVPFLIALTGLADEVGVDEGGKVIAYVALELTPGRSDALVRHLLRADRPGDTGELALAFGLVTGVASMTAAMAQIERGANRIYGIRRDRPAFRKYGRALMLTALSGVPAVGGFVIIVAGRAVGSSLQRVYGWRTPAEQVWTVMHLPVALVLTVTGMVILFRHIPRRRQPSTRWLMPGVVLTTVLWLVLSMLLAAYVNSGLSFNQIYGALGAAVALLLWANASGVALFLGLACCAQLEACRAGDPRPCEPDLWRPPADGPAS